MPAAPRHIHYPHPTTCTPPIPTPTSISPISATASGDPVAASSPANAGKVFNDEVGHDVPPHPRIAQPPRRHRKVEGRHGGEGREGLNSFPTPPHLPLMMFVVAAATAAAAAAATTLAIALC